MAFKLQTIVVGPFEVNCYLFWDDETGDGVIFDPGADGSVISKHIAKLAFTPRAILLTHGHGDHIGAVTELRRQFNVPVFCGLHDDAYLANPELNVSAFLNLPITTEQPERVVKDEEQFALGSLQFHVLSTPGHTPGGVCYLHEREGVLFCGDTLFQGSIGRTDLPGGSIDQLLESIRTKILRLPDQIVCLPGHGMMTTVGAERRSNPFLTGEYLV